MRRSFFGCCTLLCASVLSLSARPTALVGGRLIDGFGGPPLANSVILIENERVTSIGQVGSTVIP